MSSWCGSQMADDRVHQDFSSAMEPHAYGESFPQGNFGQMSGFEQGCLDDPLAGVGTGPIVSDALTADGTHNIRFADDISGPLTHGPVQIPDATMQPQS